MRDSEEVGSAARDSRHEGEDRERDRAHRQILGATDGDLVAEVIVNLIEIDREAEQFAVPKRQRNVGRLHESELHLDVKEAVARSFHRVTLPEWRRPFLRNPLGQAPFLSPYLSRPHRSERFLCCKLLI
jgi:hypothetical protein